MTVRFANRIEKIRELMSSRNLDLLVVVNRENLIYFTGLTQIECLALLIPLEGEPCAVTLWLDADYVRQKSGFTTYGYLFPKESLAGKVVDRIKAYGFNEPRIGFERYFVDYNLYDALRYNFS